MNNQTQTYRAIETFQSAIDKCLPEGNLSTVKEITNLSSVFESVLGLHSFKYVNFEKKTDTKVLLIQFTTNVKGINFNASIKVRVYAPNPKMEDLYLDAKTNDLVYKLVDTMCKRFDVDDNN